MAAKEILKWPFVDAERVAVCKKHLDFSIKWKGNVLGVIEMRRHYTNYFKGLDHFKEYRMNLVTCNDIATIYATLDEVAAQYGASQLVA